MNALRLAAAAIAITVIGGIANEIQAADKWVVRVELENKFTGDVYYPTLYSSEDKKEAYIEFVWNEMLMKVYPGKFRSDVLDEIPVGWWWEPQRMYFVQLQGINPTGRP